MRIQPLIFVTKPLIAKNLITKYLIAKYLIAKHPEGVANGRSCRCLSKRQ